MGFTIILFRIYLKRCWDFFNFFFCAFFVSFIVEKWKTFFFHYEWRAVNKDMLIFFCFFALLKYIYFYSIPWLKYMQINRKSLFLLNFKTKFVSEKYIFFLTCLVREILSLYVSDKVVDNPSLNRRRGLMLSIIEPFSRLGS